MQEQKASKSTLFIERLGKANLIWMSVCCALMLGALLTGVYVYRHLPTSHWRQSATRLPWIGEGVKIEEAAGHWRFSRGNARMELRALYYPVANLTLGEGNGAGSLLIRFTDSDGAIRGGTLALPYENGRFTTKQESNIKAKGKHAEVYAETGFANIDQITLHNLSEDSPLWRVCVWNRPNGAANERFMGYICIPATPQ